MSAISHNKKLKRESVRVFYILIREDFQDILSILIKSNLQNNMFNRILFLLKYAKRNIYKAPVMARLRAGDSEYGQQSRQSPSSDEV